MRFLTLLPLALLFGSSQGLQGSPTRFNIHQNGSQEYLNVPLSRSIKVRDALEGARVAKSAPEIDLAPSGTHQHQSGHHSGPSGHSDGSDGSYFHYAHVRDPGEYEFGYRRGNKDHYTERYEKGGPQWSFKTKVKWGDAKGGYGEHFYDYNHIDHGHHHQNQHGHGHEGHGHGHEEHYEHEPHHHGYSESVPTYKESASSASHLNFPNGKLLKSSSKSHPHLDGTKRNELNIKKNPNPSIFKPSIQLPIQNPKNPTQNPKIPHFDLDEKRIPRPVSSKPNKNHKISGSNVQKYKTPPKPPPKRVSGQPPFANPQVLPLSYYSIHPKLSFIPETGQVFDEHTGKLFWLNPTVRYYTKPGSNKKNPF